MTTRVMIELDDSTNLQDDVLRVRAALPSHNIVSIRQGRVIVDVPDSRDAEDEITNLLDGAGVRCVVYDYQNPDLLP